MNRYEAFAAAVVTLAPLACNINNSLDANNTSLKLDQTDVTALKSLNVKRSTDTDETTERPNSSAADTTEKPSSGRADTRLDLIRVNARHESPTIWATLDFTSIVSLPVALLVDGARMLVVEDNDSLFKPTNYDTYIRYELTKDGKPEVFGVDDSISVTVRLLAVDNFVDGRLRDSLGGNGGELSLQVSLAALNERGELLDNDLELLVTEDIERRLPLLTLLKGSKKGKVWVEKLEKQANDAFEFIAKVETQKIRIVNELAKVKDDLIVPAKRKAAFDRAKAGVLQAIPEPQNELRPIVGLLVDALFDRLERRLGEGSVTWDSIATEVDRVVALTEPVDLVLDAALQLRGGLGIDDLGFVERAKVIRNLAQADHYTVLEFEGIRPNAFATDGTAAVLFPTDGTPAAPSNAKTTPGPTFARNRGVVFEGTLAELSQLGEARGFALSTLLLERDSDKVAEALHAVENYAESRDLSIGIGGTELDVSLIAEALAAVADQIAEDDVELKSIDVRFFFGDPKERGGATLFDLRPCTIYVGRNLVGEEFGALAVIEIRNWTRDEANREAGRKKAEAERRKAESDEPANTSPTPGS